MFFCWGAMIEQPPLRLRLSRFPDLCCFEAMTEQQTTENRLLILNHSWTWKHSMSPMHEALPRFVATSGSLCFPRISIVLR